MRLEKIYMFLMVLGIPVAFVDFANGLGWIVGQLVMIALVFAREAFYDKVLVSASFRMKQYFSYVFFKVMLISLPLLASFLYSNILSPMGIFLAYFMDRILLFVMNIFVKDVKPNAN